MNPGAVGSNPAADTILRLPLTGVGNDYREPLLARRIGEGLVQRDELQ